MYQVCTCPILKDTCPIHGEPPKGTLTTSSTTPQGREEEVKGLLRVIQFGTNRLEALEKVLAIYQANHECQLASLRSTISHHEKVIAERNSAIDQLDRDLREQGRKIAEEAWDAAVKEMNRLLAPMKRPHSYERIVLDVEREEYLKQFEEDK